MAGRRAPRANSRPNRLQNNAHWRIAHACSRDRKVHGRLTGGVVPFPAGQSQRRSREVYSISFERERNSPPQSGHVSGQSSPGQSSRVTTAPQSKHSKTVSSASAGSCSSIPICLLLAPNQKPCPVGIKGQISMTSMQSSGLDSGHVLLNWGNYCPWVREPNRLLVHSSSGISERKFAIRYLLRQLWPPEAGFINEFPAARRGGRFGEIFESIEPVDRRRYWLDDGPRFGT